MKVRKGCLWLDREWKEAIKLSLETDDCGVEAVYKDKYPNRLLDDEQVSVGYQIYGYDNHRKYKTRIPKSLNEYTRKLLKLRSKND